MNYPGFRVPKNDVDAVWKEADLCQLLATTAAEDIHLECKAFLHFDPKLQNLAREVANAEVEKSPFHCKHHAQSHMAFNVVKAIIAFANAHGGLLLYGVAEDEKDDGHSQLDGITVEDNIFGKRFIITGIEPDWPGMLNSSFDIDKCISKLKEVLFPKGKQTYLKLTKVTGKEGNPCLKEKINFQYSYPGNYRPDSVHALYKAIICDSSNPEKPRIVIAWIIRRSKTPIVLAKHEGNVEVSTVYCRGVNNNEPLTVHQAMEFFRDRFSRASSNNQEETLDEYMERLGWRERQSARRLPKSPEELVPPHFQEALASYVIPVEDGHELPERIQEWVGQGRNVFVKGDSGMGKSLLLAHCYLGFGQEFQSCFYSIDKTSGPNKSKTSVVLKAIREQIEGKFGLAAQAHRGRQLSSSQELESLKDVLRVWLEKRPGESLVIFLDGLNENDEEKENEDISNVLRDLFQSNYYPVTWVLSSQPRKDLEYLEKGFEIVILKGLDQEQARSLFFRHLPSGIESLNTAVINEMLERFRLENGGFDPEHLSGVGKALAAKLAGYDIAVLTKESFAALMAELPATPRGKNIWLFQNYTDQEKLNTWLPGLKPHVEEWNRRCSSRSYSDFLYDILAVIAMIRRPILERSLEWALALADPSPEEDGRGRKRPAFYGYHEEVVEAERGGFLRKALQDLQDLIKLNRDGHYSFCKEAVRQSFIAFASQSKDQYRLDKLQSARLRLAWLASAELDSRTNLSKRFSYHLLEIFYLLSLSPEVAVQGLEKMLRLDYLPEWLQERAKREREKDPDCSWVYGLLADLELVREVPLSEDARARMDGLATYLHDWRYHMDRSQEHVASLIRQGKMLRHYWPLPSPSRIIAPEGGYERKVKGHLDQITCLAWLPDGRLASGSADKTVRVWDLTTGGSVVLEGHTKGVCCLAALPPGRLVSGSWDNTIRVWGLATGNSIELLGHEGGVKCLIALPNGRLASGSWDSSIRIWEVVTRRSKLLKGHNGVVNSLILLPDGHLVSGSSDGLVCLWDVDNDPSEPRVLGKHKGGVECLSMYGDNQLTSGSTDQTVRVWDPALGDCISLVGHDATVNCLATLADGRLVSAGNDGALLVWDLASDSLQPKELGRHDEGITSLTVLADNRLASGSADMTVQVWDPATRNPIVLKGHAGTVNCLAPLADGRRLASASDDKSVRIWNLTVADVQSMVMEGHTAIDSYFEDPVSDQLSVHYERDNPDCPPPDGLIVVTERDTGRMIDLKGHEAEVTCHAWLPDGRLASGSKDKTVRVWNLEARWGVIFSKHTGGVNCLAVLSANRLASGGEDCTIRIWDLATVKDKETSRIDVAMAVTCLAALSGSRLASAGKDKTVRIWRLGEQPGSKVQEEFVWFSETEITKLSWDDKESKLTVITSAGPEIISIWRDLNGGSL